MSDLRLCNVTRVSVAVGEGRAHPPNGVFFYPNRLEAEDFREHDLPVFRLYFQCSSEWGARWCQVGVKPSQFHKINIQNTCKTTLYQSGTPYEQDPEHRSSLSPRQLYSLGTIFGQQSAKPKRRRSVKSGDLYA